MLHEELVLAHDVLVESDAVDYSLSVLALDALDDIGISQIFGQFSHKNLPCKSVDASLLSGLGNLSPPCSLSLEFSY